MGTNIMSLDDRPEVGDVVHCTVFNGPADLWMIVTDVESNEYIEDNYDMYSEGETVCLATAVYLAGDSAKYSHEDLVTGRVGGAWPIETYDDFAVVPLDQLPDEAARALALHAMGLS